jgi:hypothetical protein
MVTGKKNIGNLVQFCDTHIASPRLHGFLQTFWAPTTEDNREGILKAVELLGESKTWFLKNHKK